MGEELYGAERARAALRPRPADFHKRKAVVTIAAGSRAYLGAALLCSRAAYRGGATLVRLALPADLTPYAQAALPEAVVAGLGAGGSLDGGDATAVLELCAGSRALVVGPGLGRSPGAAALASRLWGEAPLPAVFDADALHALEPGTSHPWPRILTPHEGELKALRGESALDGGRPAAARDLAAAFGSVALLKGPGTLVADPAGNLVRNPGATAVLATAGSGDVLSGLIAALLSQGLEAFEAAALGAWVHARAAELWRTAHAGADRGMLATDLAERLPEALAAAGA